MIVYAVDLDNTLVDGNLRPIPKIVDAVNRLYNAPGNLIVIHTARSSQIRQETEQLLTQLGVRYHALVMDKLRASYYIDDRMLSLDEFCAHTDGSGVNE